MSQNTATQQLQEMNIGDTRLKPYHFSIINNDVITGERVICEIYMPQLTIYKGVVLTGYMIAGGGNTANNQHYKVDFVAQIYPYTPTYLIYVSRLTSSIKLRLWQNSSNSNLFAFTVDAEAAYKSITIDYWQHPVNDYYSNPKGIRQGDPRSVDSMTGYTLRKSSS